MADITGLKTFSAGGTITSDHVNDNFYSGKTNSYRALNGHLDSDNIHSSWTLEEEQIRNQAVANGRMVGLTGNLDYTGHTFPAENTDSGAYLPIPGASITFYLPYDVAVLILTWQVTGANAQPFGGDDVCEMKMFFDNSFESHQFRAIPESRESGSPTYSKPRHPHHDRVWSGHVLKTSVTKGWHSASVRIFNSSKTVRIRVRNMKAIWFK